MTTTSIFRAAGATCMLGAALLLSGCAGPNGMGYGAYGAQPISAMPSQPGSGFGKMASSGMGAGVGCVAGALVATLTGGKPGVACAVGAVGGAAFGFVKARESELAEIRQAQQYMPGSVVQTRNVQVVDQQSGQISQVNAFSALTVPLPPRALNHPEGRKVFHNIGAVATKQDAIVTITGGGTPQQQEQAARMIRKGGANNVTVDPMVQTTVGTPGDMVIIVTPIDKSPVISV